MRSPETSTKTYHLPGTFGGLGKMPGKASASHRRCHLHVGPGSISSSNFLLMSNWEAADDDSDTNLGFTFQLLASARPTVGQCEHLGK